MLMRDTNFDPVKYAKTELTPLIDELITYADGEEASDQLLYFSGIRDSILNASNPGDLIEVFFNLSAANFLNFDYSVESAVLLDRLLEKSILLTESQSASDDGLH
tara:strand:- start:2636 stop:2950 length:315 start_codon:yes stop_codon:yes gene_type:complete